MTKTTFSKILMFWNSTDDTCYTRGGGWSRGWRHRWTTCSTHVGKCSYSLLHLQNWMMSIDDEVDTSLTESRKIVPHRTKYIFKEVNFTWQAKLLEASSNDENANSQRTRQRQRERRRRRQMRRQRNRKAKAKAKAKGESKSKAEATAAGAAAAPRTTKERTNEESTIFQKLQFPESGLGTRHCRNFTQAS